MFITSNKTYMNVWYFSVLVLVCADAKRSINCFVTFIALLLHIYTINDNWTVRQGAVSIRKTVLPGMAIPMLKIRRPNGRLIFNMEIAIRR